MKKFPILYQNIVHDPGWPDSIPWEMIKPHESQAKRNHSQSLERLAERGGLDPIELYCVLKDLPWHDGVRLIESVSNAMKCIINWIDE